jgi:DUF971 family protein
MISPTRIKREQAKLLIDWNDGHSSIITAEVLRQNCPCASCREERGDGNHSKPIFKAKPRSLRVVEHTAQESLQLDEVRLVGNYAVGLTWRDGHSTGIYPFTLLLELAR